MKNYFVVVSVFLTFSIVGFAQNADNSAEQAINNSIVKSEDERRFDSDLESLLKSKSPSIIKRATLAAGRIGDSNAVSHLIPLLDDENAEIREMAAFALGEIESIKGAEAIAKAMTDSNEDVRARAVEAAGKIVAANSENATSSELGKAVLNFLVLESRKKEIGNDRGIILGLTALLRAKPEGADTVANGFLGHSNPRVRADALNTLARLNSKSSYDFARTLLEDIDPLVRANAARLIARSENPKDTETLLKLATSDTDNRTRINAIRALGVSKSESAGEALVVRGNKLLARIKDAKEENSPEKNELLTIISSLGNIFNEKMSDSAISLIVEFRKFVNEEASEAEIALAKIDPPNYLNGNYLHTIEMPKFTYKNLVAFAQGLSATKGIESNQFAYERTKNALLEPNGIGNVSASDWTMALPNMLQLFGKYEFPESDGVIIQFLSHDDVFVRAAAARILSNREPTKEINSALELAFRKSLREDKEYDDAQLSLLNAVVKSDKINANGALNLALDSSSYLVRKRAVELIESNNLSKDFPNADKRVGIVRRHDPKNDSKLGQSFYSDEDYDRAISRKNGTARAFIATEKGEIKIEFFPEDAPITVDNFIGLAQSGYFDGVEIHRVVPNFVVQDGDPRGDGNGGPGWQIRCEINMLTYDRGAVGMALSGKDTGGSQWFITHSPQPHLDGGYTVFGRVNETDMKIVDQLVKGDKILSIRIEENN